MKLTNFLKKSQKMNLIDFILNFTNPKKITLFILINKMATNAISNSFHQINSFESIELKNNSHAKNEKSSIDDFDALAEWCAGRKIENEDVFDDIKPSAPPVPANNNFELLAWYLFNFNISGPLENNTIFLMEDMWHTITGSLYWTYFESPNLLDIILDLQMREWCLLKLYTNGKPVNRYAMNAYHYKFLTEFNKRVFDFPNNVAFLQFIDEIIEKRKH